MTRRTSRVSLRYRPGPDVLSGEVELGQLGPLRTAIESLDADTTMTWAAGESDGYVEYLASFHVVHASARLSVGTMPLPEPLHETAATLVLTALEAIADVDNPASRLRARAEAFTELPLEALRRSEWPERPPGSSDPQRAAEVSTSLARLAEAVGHQVTPYDAERASHTHQLSRLLQELSSTISSSDGLTAPGTSAATRLVAQRVLLDEAKIELDQALAALDDPGSWSRALRSFESLTASLEGSTRGG